MSAPEQIVFPFASLDFPGRSAVTLGEIAGKLQCTVQHLINEVEKGALMGVDIKGAGAARSTIRVPVEAYRAYVLARMTDEFRADFVRDLPPLVRRGLMRDLAAVLLAETPNPDLRATLRALNHLLHT